MFVYFNLFQIFPELEPNDTDAEFNKLREPTPEKSKEKKPPKKVTIFFAIF